MSVMVLELYYTILKLISIIYILAAHSLMYYGVKLIIFSHINNLASKHSLSETENRSL